jgi:DNA-directed RNA polymerase
MFSSARLVMAWLAACAREVGAHGAPVAWHTPLGLPIVQPYRRKARPPAPDRALPRRARPLGLPRR